MKELPKRQGGLDSTVGRSERRQERIEEMTSKVMGMVPAGAVSTSPAHPAAAPKADPDGGAGAPRPEPGGDGLDKTQGLVSTIETQGRSYQEEQERIAQGRRRGDLEREAKERQAKKRKMPTSVKLTQATKKDIVVMNARLYDYDVKLNLRGLIMYAMENLKGLPDSKVAELMRPFDVDNRRSSDEDEDLE
jgi:hypothetical protein